MNTKRILRHSICAAWVALWFCGVAWAEHRDPVPIPDDVIQKLFKSFHIGSQPDRLPDALSHSLDEAVVLLQQMENDDAKSNSDLPTAAQRMLLESKIHEIRSLRDEFRSRLVERPSKKSSKSAKPGVLTTQDVFARQIEDRFARVIGALESVQAGTDRHTRNNARGRARQVLYELHEKPREYRQSTNLSPIPTWRQDTPTDLKPSDLEQAPPPQYLASQPVPANNMYAFLGDAILLAAAPEPIPTQAQSCSYTSADLGTSQEIQITDEIKKLAEKLSYSPVKIYQYVSTEIQFEPYFGSLKGAMGTLYSKAGNATDQASLLIALLRASNIPARYVRGTIQFDNDPRALRWIGAKALAALGQILLQGKIAASYDTASNHIEFDHVWVEACVPYGNYRGTGIDKTGFRWVPLDASFKEKTYQAGIVTNVNFDYTGYLTKRLNGPDSLPHEYYAKQVETSIKILPPNYSNNTLQDVGYIGAPTPRTVDILPASLPYSVKAFSAWGAGLTAEIAEVPDSHRYKFEISTTGFSAPVTLSMPQIVLQRITFSYRGASSTDQTNYEGVLNGTFGSSCGQPNSSGNMICTNTPIYLLPVIKLDGTETAVGSAINIYSVSSVTCNVNTGICTPTDSRTHPTLTLSIKLNSASINSVSFSSKVNMMDMFAFQAYAFQASDRLLNERATRLLFNVRNIADPNTNRDETIGEFLHLSGLKYMHYITDASKRLGELDGGSGWSGNHLGLTSTISKAQYLFDLPYAINSEFTIPPNPYFPGYSSKDLLVDVPGGLSRNVDLFTGDLVWKTFLLTGYTASAYESYLWQENAKLDAVSTVRGIQFAKENVIEVLSITSANQATELPKLTSNTNSVLNYTSAQVTQIQNLLNQGYTLTLPRSLIQYSNWKGSVWVQEKNAGASMSAGFIIGGAYSGGYTVGNYLPSLIDTTLNTGFNITTPSLWTNYYSTPPFINSGIGSGITSYTTTAGDPVNMVTGNMYHTERDISIKGRGSFPIVFERSYNSREAKDGPLGFGWTHSFNHYLVFKDDNADGASDSGDTDGVVSSVSWIDGSGSEKFIKVTGSVFTPPPGFFFQTTRNADGTYSIREKNGLTYTFENVAGTITPSGQKGAKLLNIKDRNGNTLTMGYNGANLTSVTDGLGRALTFTPDGNNHITQISDWTGRQWIYEYNTNGDLITYKNPLAVSSPATQPSVTYTYYTAADGQNLNHAMKKYTLPRGNGMTFEYYMNGRVFRHYNTLGETMTFTYNDFRRETVSVNERSFERHFFFDANGNPLKIVEENGSIRQYTYSDQPCTYSPCPPYNPFNRLSKRDPMGYGTSYVYDITGNVVQINNPSGSVVLYSYFNSFNQPGRIKDARSNYTLYKYDAKGNLLEEIKLKSGYGSTTNPATYTPVASQIAAWTINTYDAYGNVLTTKRVRDFTTQVGPSVEYSYNDTVNNAQGLNAVTITRRGDKNGDGTIAGTEFDNATLAYDNLGRVKTGIDADWHTKQYFYDSLDRVTRATDAVGNLRDYVYDQNGNPVGESLTLAINGVSTLQDSNAASYDKSDRKSLDLDTAGNAMRYDYDPAGNVIQITNPDNYSLAFEYDAGNHVTKAYDRENNAVTRTLDLDGKPRTVTDPNGNTVRYSYYGSEREGRLKSQTDALNRVTTYDYDPNGNVITVTDNLGRTTRTDYDELNRPTRVAGPSYTDVTFGLIRPLTTYSYDNLGRLASIMAGRTDSTGTNPATDVVTTQMLYVYDDFGRKLKETDALGKFWTYEYDLNGNVTKVTDPKNQLTQYIWGYGHQLLSRKDANGNLTSYIRNALGQPLVATSPGVRYNYSYDDAHRLKSVTDSRGNKTLTYVYSPGGLLNTLTDGEGKRTDYLYDPVGRLTGIWAPNLDYVGYNYDPAGRLTEKWLPNGVNTRYQYNPDNTLVQVTNRVNGTVLSQHDYTYDGVGNRMTHIELINGTTTPYKYLYDELNRLKEVRNNTTNALIESYSNDPLGNRTTKIAGATTYYYSYDAANELQDIRTGSPTGTLVTGLVYDANGNLTQKCESGTVTRTDTACTGTTVTTLTYSALNQLTQATKTNLPPETYVYDDRGRRIQKTTSATTNYLYNGPDITAEYGTNWASPSALYTHGPNWDDPILRTAGTATQYYHQDGLGSVVGLTDQAGATVGSQRFDAWGVKLASTGTIPQYGYTGREPDATGLIYYRERTYDPTTGTFTQPDPLGMVEGVNRRAYVRNNPVNYTDPTGTQAFNNSLTYLNTYNTNYYGTSTASASGVGYLSSGSQSLASVTPSPSSSFSGLGAGTYTGASDLPLEAPLFAPDDLIGTGVFKAGGALMVGAIRTVGRDMIGAGAEVAAADVSFSFGQASVKSTFAHGPYAGNTIGEVAQGLRSGAISPDTLPIDYILRNSQAVTLNNRSLLALKRAGMQPTVTRNLTGIPDAEALLNSHLQGGVPSSVIRVRGGPPNTSLIE